MRRTRLSKPTTRIARRWLGVLMLRDRSDFSIGDPYETRGHDRHAESNPAIEIDVGLTRGILVVSSIEGGDHAAES